MSAQFPGINFTVTAKADSKFKIVGAASVAAKVTRDAWIEGWKFEESSGKDGEYSWGDELGSGYPSGWTKLFRVYAYDRAHSLLEHRPEDASVDQVVIGADVRVSFTGAIFMDNDQGGFRQERPRCQMVRIIPNYGNTANMTRFTQD